MSKAVILDGDSLARNIRAGLTTKNAFLRAAGTSPRFVTVLVGDNPASERYVTRKHADCREMGIASDEIHLGEHLHAQDLERTIEELNVDPSVQGFLVQLPLPEHLDDSYFLSLVSPLKDVDGLHPENLGRLLGGEPFLLPCTPAGILTLLQHHEVPVAGSNVVIVGRGPLVGRPLAMLLSMKGIDATVTLAHTKTPNLARLTVEANVVVAAVGEPNLIRADMVRPGAAVVGVGITYDTGGGAIVSDVADDVQEVAGWVTPRHGSVGSLTRAMLFANLLKLAEYQNQPGNSFPRREHVRPRKRD